MSFRGCARRVVLIAAAVTAVVCGPAPAATAHSELVATDPPAGAELTAAPAQAALTFSESVEPQFATVVVSVAGSAEQEVATRVDGPVVTAELPDPASATGEPQPWRVTYRVVSGDGHPITGTVDFTVSSPASPPTQAASPSSLAPPAETPTASAQPPAAGEPSATSAAAAEDAGAARASPPWSWFLASALFMALVAGGAVVLGRRQRRRAQM